MSNDIAPWGEHEAIEWLIGEGLPNALGEDEIEALRALPGLVVALPGLIGGLAATEWEATNWGEDEFDELWENIETTIDDGGGGESEVAFIAVAEVLIAASELGLAVFDRVRGSSSFAAATASYIHNPSPRGLTVQTKTFEFPITCHHPRYGISNQTFWFRVTLEYDGFNVRRASVIQDRDRSSTMVMSDFSIDFTPSAFTPTNEPVAAVVYNITGRWDPVGSGDESFDGRFVLDAAGNLRGLTVSSPQRWVTAGTVRSSGGGAVPRPTRAIQATAVHFSPEGSATVDAAGMRHLNDWFRGLPPAVQDAVRRGTLPIQLTGRTSTTGAELSNQSLGRRRADAVATAFRNLASTSAQFILNTQGELGARTPDRQPSSQERRVDIRIEYDVYDIPR